MKKTSYIWIIIILLSISLLTEVLSVLGFEITGLQAYYGAHTVLNYIAVMSLVADIILTAAFVYKLYALKAGINIWIDLYFSWSVFRLMFAIIADFVSSKGTAITNAVEIVILIVIWITLRRHLAKIIEASVPTSNLST